MEPCLKPPRTTPQPLKKLVELLWNCAGTGNPGPPAALEPLVEPSWNLTSNHPDHPAALADGGTLVEPSWILYLTGTPKLLGKKQQVVKGRPTESLRRVPLSIAAQADNSLEVLKVAPIQVCERANGPQPAQTAPRLRDSLCQAL